ncbi:hypothetical protein [Aliikangiella coralliicola]|uniref:Uncharacterized protein n=1 Tax=Aliikangiella coralliicola TaxID=2592383 RepID=A0A545UEW3_9GAMM|nr:hypothetical protein [Aliikangiella coralliicola]TQV88016.1 hypothetical protein FLL46_09400 [Aliikangiella coralliicola]
MKYEIITKSWSKRRKLDTAKEITNIQFLDFIKQHNHFCKMQITYSDGSEETLLSRVVFNEVKQHWTVDGMKVAVRLLNV